MSFTIDPSKVIRVPESAFRNVPDFPYKPRYDHFGSLRYAFIDEESPVVFHDGKALPLSELNAKGNEEELHWETYICFHGEPTWSFLYRRMIPVFLNKPATKGSHMARKYVRRRVLAPDFIGFGRSDKPTDMDFYTWDMHHEFIVQFVQKHVANEPRGTPKGSVAAVVQDWGGLLGLTLPSLFPRLFTHLLIMNTAFGVGANPGPGFVQWRDFMGMQTDPNIANIVAKGTQHLTGEEKQAYAAPYPNKESKAGARKFPALVPTSTSMSGVPTSRAASAYFSSLSPSSFRAFLAIGSSDPVLGKDVMLRNVLPAFKSSTGALVMYIPEAGHFVQEWGGPIAEKAVDCWAVESDEEVRAEGVERVFQATKVKGDAKL